MQTSDRQEFDVNYLLDYAAPDLHGYIQEPNVKMKHWERKAGQS